MPTRITLIYHAYKNFEVPNKIAKMINDGTISWRSHHNDLFYTDENGKEQCVSSNSECVAWEGHDDYEVAESEEESDDEEEVVDDVDAPNIFPYKKCSDCGERKSCGNYNNDKVWFCEHCYEEESECCECQQHGDDGCKCDCHSEPSDSEEDEDDDENDSVCFRVPHEYNEKECSDNCPHKPEEEEENSESK
jgi:hypothetical protein